MLCKRKLLYAWLVGAGAAAIGVLCAGGYLLHKAVLKHRMHEFVQQQAMSQALYDICLNEDFEDMIEDIGGYDDEAHDDYDDDYFDNLMGLNQEAHT